jgi:hypothetical protein
MNNDIQFDTDNAWARPQRTEIGSRSSFSKILIKSGLAKDEKSANQLLLVVAVVATIIGGVILFSGGDSSSFTTPQFNNI